MCRIYGWQLIGCSHTELVMWDVLRADVRRHGGWKHGGSLALAVYRYGRWSLSLSSPLARWLTSKTYGAAKLVVKQAVGVELDRCTELGDAPHFIHTGMIMIHPEAKIGDRVGIMHGVTIGTNMGAGVPTIGSDVFIGCHASVLGAVTIGDGARIGANSLVTSDVPPGAFAVGVPARIIRMAIDDAPPVVASVTDLRPRAQGAASPDAPHSETSETQPVGSAWANA